MLDTNRHRHIQTLNLHWGTKISGTETDQRMGQYELQSILGTHIQQQAWENLHKGTF